MRAFLIAALCTSLAYAKPQYNYPAPSIPSTNYGRPVIGGGVSTALFGGGLGGGSTPFGLAAGGASFGGSFSANRGIGSQQDVSTSAVRGGFGGGFGGGAGGGFGGGFVGGAGGGFEGGAGGGFEGGAGGGFRGGVGTGFVGGVGGGTLVQKHIYVHVAPPEPEEFRQQTVIGGGGRSTKHYKIIFIKAPSYEAEHQRIIQQQALNQEKTLVYVLVKKPEALGDITLPTAAPAPINKPEVYFIRYKAKSAVTGVGGIGATGSQLIGGGPGLGGGLGNLNIASGSSSSSQFSTGGGLNLNTGDASSSISAIRPKPTYGPPGQSGPYK